MESWLGWALIAGMAIVALFTRAVFVLPGSHLRLPPTAERILRYAPAAALMAIIVPDIGSDSARLIGGLVAFVVAVATRSAMLTVVGGMLALGAVRLLAG